MTDCLTPRRFHRSKIQIFLLLKQLSVRISSACKKNPTKLLCIEYFFSNGHQHHKPCTWLHLDYCSGSPTENRKSYWNRNCQPHLTPSFHKKHCSCSSWVLQNLRELKIIYNLFLLSHAEWSNNLQFFSILVYFVKSQSMILLKKNFLFKENYSFCYLNFPVRTLIPHWAVMLRTCASIYIHNIYAIHTVYLPFHSTNSCRGNLCRFPRHIPPVFTSENDSSCHGW